jgi:hypothetical protein
MIELTLVRIVKFWLLCCSAIACATPNHFITRDGHRLMDGLDPLRFAGIHAPELHRIEDDARGKCEADSRDWGQYFKWPTAQEQENWIKALTRSGHRVMRIYVLSIEQSDDQDCGRETHILRPEKPGGMPRLNESAMRHYDRMIALAARYDLLLILPFIDHWEWWGGRKQLAEFYGETAADFYDVESRTYAAYLSVIEQVITRTNHLTGRRYSDERTIMAWETGNELKHTTADFLRETAAYIKSLDSNHLVVDGTYSRINDYALEDPNIDIISNHYYLNQNNATPDQVLIDLKKIGGKKAYLVGEFGLLPAQQIEEIMEAIVNTEHQGASAAGAFVWSFRGHRHEGGFYWHKDHAHYSYHLPGFPEGDANEEQRVINMVRRAQAQMNGRDTPPPLPRPEPPRLHPISDPAVINWLGAPLGRFYDIERSLHPNGPWRTLGEHISDGMNLFDPEKDALFSDTDELDSGTTYYYRVSAQNESGRSDPSNVVTYTPPID